MLSSGPPGVLIFENFCRICEVGTILVIRILATLSTLVATSFVLGMILVLDTSGRGWYCIPMSEILIHVTEPSGVVRSYLYSLISGNAFYVTRKQSPFFFRINPFNR